MKITKHLSERNFLFLAIIWTIGITIASLVSFNSVPKVSIPGNDKVVHFIFYLVFVILWSLAKRKAYFNVKYGFLIMVLAIFYGTVIEVLQSVFTKTREADFYDVLANSTGAFVGFFAFLCLNNKKIKKSF